MNLNSQDFEFVCKFARHEAALVLDAGKEYLVESRLTPLLRIYQCANISELISRLRSPIERELRNSVIDALTTHETSFFRDSSPFDAMKSILIPEVLQRNSSSRTLTIWCGASSTGQEPYSLAILLREHFPQLRDWKVLIIATDISLDVLKKAEEGKYSQLEVNRGLQAVLLVKYFTRTGEYWQINPEIRSLVNYRQLNLAHGWSSIPPCDFVFLRNVLIYFDIETKKSILTRIATTLAPSGCLFLGTAETPLNLVNNYSRRDLNRCSCYVLG